MLIDLDAMLAKGYLPKELPAPFSSTTLATLAARATTLQFTNRNGRSGDPLAIAIRHNLARPGQLRRRLHILNPISFYRLATLVTNSWAALNQKISRSKMTVSNPIKDPNDLRCVVPRLSGASLQQSKVERRAASRFLLQTDVARFYPSIYTHSIPWAIDGKKQAKANRKGGLANDLDLFSRNAQDGQTMGIPVGPDTSLVIAEVVAAAVDECLMNEGLDGLRFMDDYEIACETRQEAEQALEQIERALADYELAINPRKTRIQELPLPLDYRWRREIADFKFGKGERTSRRDVIRFFDTTFELHRDFPNEPVIAYAISRLRSVKFSKPIWDLCRPLVCQSLLAEPAAMRYVHHVLRHHEAHGLGSDVERALNTMIRVHSGLDHGSEVAWALWTCVRLGISISDPAAQALGGNRDGVVRVLALLARDKQVLRQAGPFAQWEAELSPDSLYDENWLYAYEAAVQGWLSSKGSVVTNDPNFNLLKSGGVSFLDLTLLGPDEDEQDDELSFDPYGGEEDTDDDDDDEEPDHDEEPEDDEEPEGEFRPSVADSYPR